MCKLGYIIRELYFFCDIVNPFTSFFNDVRLTCDFKGKVFGCFVSFLFLCTHSCDKDGLYKLFEHSSYQLVPQIINDGEDRIFDTIL